MMNASHCAAYAAELTDRTVGFVLLPGFLSAEEADCYRSACERFLKTGRRIHARINRPDMFDYVHPRMVLSDGRITKGVGRNRDANTLRIYQFLHNRHPPETRAIFDRVLGLRDRIESHWTHDTAYREVRDQLFDYVQVTRYLEDSRGLPKHQDSKDRLPYPLLQCLILLSSPRVDYRGGDLALYPKQGPPVRMVADRGMAKGDLLLFDKTLFHEVEPTQPAPGSTLGRWSAVLGGRDRLKGRYVDRYLYSTLYLERIKPLLKKLRLLR